MIETIEEIKCARCGKVFDSASFYEGEVAVFQRTLCDPCDQMKVKENKRIENEKDMPLRLGEFKAMCPAAYFDSDMSRLPHTPLGHVVNYKFGYKGIFCVGDSGRGKTRSCWLKLKQLYLSGVRMTCLTESTFAEKIDRYSENRETDRYLEELRRVQLLFIDDIGHAALDKKYLQRLLQVVEGRTSCNRPIIATSQYTGNELIGRLQGSEKTLAAIVRRLRDFCQIINFNEN